MSFSRELNLWLKLRFNVGYAGRKSHPLSPTADHSISERNHTKNYTLNFIITVFPLKIARTNSPFMREWGIIVLSTKSLMNKKYP
ncbi:9018_t:CDS:2 [Diversispora eburnea]|uniref:9018_t:CDS:1 n=1 Tax=Diversispora eburnea TaxID=1213867 RepID=A0A9N8UZ94_9GLOM|nr:9018_t:CDS:2 [Diversispora eburnea]